MLCLLLCISLPPAHSSLSPAITRSNLLALVHAVSPHFSSHCWSSAVCGLLPHPPLVTRSLCTSKKQPLIIKVSMVMSNSFFIDAIFLQRCVFTHSKHVNMLRRCKLVGLDCITKAYIHVPTIRQTGHTPSHNNAENARGCMVPAALRFGVRTAVSSPASTCAAVSPY